MVGNSLATEGSVCDNRRSEEDVNITVIGRGNVGGGLASRWERAGHDVQPLGREGGDAGDAEVIVIAVPGGEVADALAKVSGIEGKVAIDTTNVVRGRNSEFESNAHWVKSLTNGPVAKSFNLNFARVYDEIDAQRVRPSNLYAADDEAREVTERLSRDAGYDPVSLGGLEFARAMEDGLRVLFAANQAGLGPFFYRFAKPGEL
jgi:predicted dinucleotide-binding enzyme